MRTSTHGLGLIKKHEGLVLKAYLCPAAVCTIGYGHTATAQPGQRITEPQAEQLLVADLADAEAAVGKLVKVPLQQAQFDALVSFVFNVGAGNFKSSTLLQRINLRDQIGAVREFGKWTKARVKGKMVDLPGLVRRRADEAQMFLSGLGDTLEIGEGGVVPERA